MAYTKPQTLDASPSGDTVKTAIVSKLDVNATQIVSDLNTHEALTETHGATGAVVGTTNTQTLTNKTLTSPVITTPQINDTSADHQYIVAVSELLADRTVTLPLLTGNDEFVFKDHTQTLTNKTLTSPVLNTGVSGTGVDTDGTLAANSDTLLASQKAVKTYADTKTTLTAVKADSDIADAISKKHANTLDHAHYLFNAYITSTLSNVTGDATAYTLTGAIWTEVTDASSVFSNGTFTAPATGTYHFTGSLYLDDLASAHSVGSATLTVGSTLYVLYYGNIGVIASGAGHLQIPFSVIAKMTKDDTAVLGLTISNGTKVVDVKADYSRFSGYFIG